jgi:hypothetical protein
MRRWNDAAVGSAACSLALCLGMLSCAGGRESGGSRAPAVEPSAPPSDRLAGGAPSEILAGAAARLITPDDVGPGSGVRVAGFGPGVDATGVHDPLYARALVLEAGGRTIAFVALDLIGLFHDDVVRIRETIRDRFPGARLDYVLVASTHTHAGPDVLGLWTPADRSIDSGYIARIRREAAGAVHDAWEGRRPARLSFAAARLPHLVRDSRMPQVIDDRALLMKADSIEGGETFATLMIFANHPESLGRSNTLISSDFPGAARRSLEEIFGGVAIFMSGAVGGLMTPLGVELSDPETGEPLPKKSFRMVDRIGRELGMGLADAWRARHANEAPERIGMTEAAFDVDAREVRVPLDNRRFVEGLMQGRIWPRSFDDEGRLTSEVAVVTMRVEGMKSEGASTSGRPLAQFACVPGEIYPELVDGGIEEPQDPGADFQGAEREPALRALMSAPHRFVLGLCNDELGYIIPRSQWDAEPPFAYGRERPQYGEINSAGPSTAPLLLQAFADLLR